MLLGRAGTYERFDSRMLAPLLAHCRRRQVRKWKQTRRDAEVSMSLADHFGKPKVSRLGVMREAGQPQHTSRTGSGPCRPPPNLASSEDKTTAVVDETAIAAHLYHSEQGLERRRWMQRYRRFRFVLACPGLRSRKVRFLLRWLRIRHRTRSPRFG